MKHVRVEDGQLNSLDNGNYTVRLVNVRDELGNSVDGDLATSGTQTPTIGVKLR